MVTRADDLRALVTKLQEHGHDCVDGGEHEFEAAHHVIAAAENIVAAIDSLYKAGTAEDELAPRLPPETGG